MKLSGKEASEKMLEESQGKIEEMDKEPKLGIVLVGNDPASEIYVEKKMEKASSIGVETELKRYDSDIKENKLLGEVEKLNESNIDGYIVQAPLPDHIDYNKVLETIDRRKDVDGWTPYNMGKTFTGSPGIRPATPKGIMYLLDYYNIEIKGKNATVVGRSNIVGRPLSAMLLNRDATTTVCHSKTRNLEEHTKSADIVVAAVGKPGLITGDMVKSGSAVIDVGTTRVDGKLKGDVKYDEVIEKDCKCTPVPGGVGPMTVASLISNVVEVAEN